MDFTAIRNDPNPEGRIFEKILPHTGTKSAYAAYLEKKLHIKPDPLAGVKLDPAVLEAQVTVNVKEKSEHTPAAPTKKPNDAVFQSRLNFEKAMLMERAAVMSLSGPQLNFLMSYVNTLRLQRQSTQKQLECAFCKNNGHAETWYTTHSLKDGSGRVRCPMLRAFWCRRCGATGDNAHTIKYCPYK